MLSNWDRAVVIPLTSTICCRTRGFLRERRFESARVPSSCHWPAEDRFKRHFFQPRWRYVCETRRQGNIEICLSVRKCSVSKDPQVHKNQKTSSYSLKCAHLFHWSTLFYKTIPQHTDAFVSSWHALTYRPGRQRAMLLLWFSVTSTSWMPLNLRYPNDAKSPSKLCAACYLLRAQELPPNRKQRAPLLGDYPG